MNKRIVILGSTGSIGTQALEVIDKLHQKIKITALSGGNNIDLLLEQTKKYRPEYVCVKNENDIKYFKGLNVKVFSGSEGLIKVASSLDVDIVLVALSGKIGLKPTIAAIKNKKNIALANKETLVMAGGIIMNLAKENNVKIIPVDSEHSAIFQCIQNKNDINRLIITASGGPFLHSSIEQIEQASVENTLNHPKWKMGKKITIDSATLMNKGLEVIEAHHLFNVDYNNINVVIHPQSVVHSAVEFKDGSILAQIGLASMHLPIQYALTYPERVKGIKSESFDFIKTGKFEFFEPDYEKFPLLNLAIKAGKIGGTATACLNAANEEAVLAFLNGKIKLTDIYKITKAVFDDYTPKQNPDIEEILEEDEKVRKITNDIIDSRIFA